jgi:hypothetical protein
MCTDVSEEYHLHLEGRKSSEQETSIPEDGEIRYYRCGNLKSYKRSLNRTDFRNVTDIELKDAQSPK